MAFLDFLNPVFDIVFGWLLPLPPFWSIMILSLIMSLIIVVITKYTTDQNVMKHLKEESKSLQQQMKTLKEHPEKMLEVQKRHMESSMKYMRQSFRPLLWTFLPIILIFGWISAHLAYEPIMPGQEFSVRVELAKGLGRVNVTADAPEGILLTSDASKEVTDGIVIFTFKAEHEGRFDAPGLVFSVDGKSHTKDVLISAKREYITPIKAVRDKTVKQIETMHDKVKVVTIGSVAIGWIWSYIVFSIVFSSLLRKWLKVY